MSTPAEKVAAQRGAIEYAAAHPKESWGRHLVTSAELEDLLARATSDGQTIAALRAELAERDAAVSVLRGVCERAHDRLLRGDSDREILDILQTGWQAAAKHAPKEGIA
jgi:hypothetical protein